MARCQKCGAYSGKYPLCYKHSQSEKEKRFKKYGSKKCRCGTLISKDQRYCYDCRKRLGK